MYMYIHVLRMYLRTKLLLKKMKVKKKSKRRCRPPGPDGFCSIKPTPVASFLQLAISVRCDDVRAKRGVPVSYPSRTERRPLGPSPFLLTSNTFVVIVFHTVVNSPQATRLNSPTWKQQSTANCNHPPTRQ